MTIRTSASNLSYSLREVVALAGGNAKLVFGQREASDRHVIRNDGSGDVALAVGHSERLSRVNKRRARPRAKEDVVLRRQIQKQALKVLFSLTPHPAPVVASTQFSPPTQKSDEPESISTLKSRGGVPICTVATSAPRCQYMCVETRRRVRTADVVGFDVQAKGIVRVRIFCRRQATVEQRCQVDLLKARATLIVI